MTTPIEAHGTSAAINAAGLACFSVATCWLWLGTMGEGMPVKIMQAAGYMACSVLFWIIQMAYHLVLRGGRQDVLLRNVDRGTVFLLIAGTFTPLVAPVNAEPGATIVLVVVLWGGAAGGMVLLISWKSVPRSITPLLALVLAIAGIVGTAWFSVAGSPVELERGVTLVAGAGALLAGGAVYAIKKPNPIPGKFGFHELYHALALVGTLSLHVLVMAVLSA